MSEDLHPSPETEPNDASSLLGTAVLVYGAMLALAVVWSLLRNLELAAVSGDGEIPYALFVGFFGAFVLLSFGWTAGALVPAARRLAGEMASGLVQGTGFTGLLLLALLSGVCEEILFRGVLQQEFGLVVASVVFGAVHFVPERRFLLWTAYAIVAGFVLGGMYGLTGGLLAPITAHVANNAVVLLWWKLRSGRGVE